MTQQIELHRYLSLYTRVTPMVARKELGIESLSSVVSRLNKYPDVTITKTFKRSHGGKRYASYELEV